MTGIDGNPSPAPRRPSPAVPAQASGASAADPVSRPSDAQAAESLATSSGLTALTASSFTNARPAMQAPSASGLRRPSMAYALSRQGSTDKANPSSASRSDKSTASLTPAPASE